MPIEAGTRVGRYEIQSLLAVGGMGEVYQARDIELARSVALKFLSAEFSSNRDRMKRFIQEARAASALNHPNIITVYEIGRVSQEEDATPFIATELIVGVTLREYISRTRLKLGELLDIAIQITSALVAAHEAGIVHRDIKPDNVMVRRDGYVKVLDFGLAKPIETIFAATDSEAKTKALVKTERGALMGTVSYMSPEQARGSELDARTDVWSLGVVLYEALTGHTPFAGETPSHVIVSILENDPPPLATYLEDVPEALEWIVAEALTRDREERTQTAKEMLSKLRRLKQRIDSGAELERSLDPSRVISAGSKRASASQNEHGRATASRKRSTARSGEVGATPAASSAEYVVNQIQQHKKGALLAFVLSLLAIVGVALGIYAFVTRSHSQTSAVAMKVSRLTNNGKSSTCAISPDGKYVAHVFRDGDKQSLRLRQTAATSSREIVPATDGYFLGATFSPDGNFVYYVKGERGTSVRTLYQISVLGGDSRQLISDIDSPVTFSPNGQKIAFARNYTKEQERILFVANSDGSGEERLAMRKNPPFTGIDSPAWSPDGKRIAFILSGDDTQGYYVNIDEIGVQDHTERKISSDRWRTITSIAWLADGTGLVAVARDRASVAGSPSQIWTISYPNGRAHRLTNDLNYYVDVSLSADSRTLVAGLRSQTASVSIVPEGGDTNRARELVSGNSAGLEGVNWTPDGRILYTSVERDNRDVWIMNADGTGQKQLTFESSADLYPAASPDGRYIIFESNRGGRWSIWRMNSDGTNVFELARIDSEFGDPQFSPDSRWVFYSANAAGKQVAWKVPVDGGTPAQLTDQQMHSLSVSPDGKLIAYYCRPPEFNAKLQIEIVSAETRAPVKTFALVGDGNRMRWSPDGQALDYIETHGGVSNLWRMPLNGGQPHQLTNWKSDLIYWFAWSRDGKQLACARGSSSTDLVLIENLNQSE